MDHHEQHHHPAPAPEPDKPLTQAEIVAEATNDPQLSKDEFELGGRKFKVVSLGYRQYLQFVSKFEPIAAALSSKVKDGFKEAFADRNKVEIPGLILQGIQHLNSSNLLKFCGEDLPALTAIVCNMEAIAAKRPESELIDAAWVEDHATSPFELVDIVFRQVNKNNMIVQFAGFFAQFLPMLLPKNQSPAK